MKFTCSSFCTLIFVVMVVSHAIDFPFPSEIQIKSKFSSILTILYCTVKDSPCQYSMGCAHLDLQLGQLSNVYAEEIQTW